jgi:hypothetical protein
MIHAVGYAMLGLIGVTGALVGLLVLISMLREHRVPTVRCLGWTGVLREVIRTDSQMLTDAFRLSMAHFRAVNELRRLGGRR